ncbi:MAG TPA: energy transducer TonB [Planctomycetota bacterium]|nr:energy transducer TonB [Planctomycetota bacterium]
MASQAIARVVTGALHHLLVALGAVGLTLVFFLVLPLMQAIHKPPELGWQVRNADSASLEPPPPMEEPEPEEDEPEEEPEPELDQEVQPLDLGALELALGSASGDGFGVAGFALDLSAALSGGNDLDELVSMADLDQRPRAIHQPSPQLGPDVRKAGGGTVYILFVVDPNGRVESPIVQKQVHPALDKAALAAVKQWRFEPGRRNGDVVRFRMRVPITFPEGS